MRTLVVLSALALIGCGGDKASDTGDTSATTGGTAGGGTAGTTTTSTTETEVDVPGGLAVAFIPHTIAAGANTRDAKVLDMGDGHMLTADRQTIEVATNLTLEVGLDDVEPPMFFDPKDWIDAVQVPEPDRLPVELNGTVIDVWYMGPFDYHSSAGIPVTIANTYGVDPSGGTIELWVGSYEASGYIKVGTASDDGAGNLVFDGDLELISTIVLIDSEGQSNPPADAGGDGDSTLSGVITGPDGSPYEGARVQYCRGDNCLTSRTDASGAYEITDSSPGIGSFEVIP